MSLKYIHFYFYSDCYCALLTSYVQMQKGNNRTLTQYSATIYLKLGEVKFKCGLDITISITFKLTMSHSLYIHLEHLSYDGCFVSLIAASVLPVTGILSNF